MTSGPQDSALPEQTPAAIPRWYWLAYLTGGFGLALNAMMNFLLPLRATDLGIGIGLIGPGGGDFGPCLFNAIEKIA